MPIDRERVGPRLAPRRDLVAWGLSIAIIGTALVAISPLRGLGGAPPVAAALRLSPLYVVLAPWCDVLDNLTLMSARQHFALLITLFASYFIWQLTRHRRNRSPLRHAVGAIVFIAIVGSVYVAGLLLPRPMAAIQLREDNAVAIDFHSHTSASWDGRQNFLPESNRAWHQSAGFNAVYISDHGTLAGAISGQIGNAETARHETAILPAVEIRCEGQHVVILGATVNEGIADCSAATIPASSPAEPLGHWEAEGMITLLTIPARFRSDQPIPTSQAIEIADGAPRALDQMVWDSSMIRRIARASDLAVVSGSNNHGWGRTAVAWSVMRINHWRSMTPGELDAAIRARLRGMRATAVYVVERQRVAPGISTLSLTTTLPAVTLNMFRTMSLPERASWLVWVWVLWAAVAVGKRKRASQAATGYGGIEEGFKSRVGQS